MLKSSSILLCLLLISGNVNALTLCDEEFSEMNQDKKYLGIGEKINYWESLSDKCSGSGLYESRLGRLYFEAGNYGKAKDILKKAISAETKFHKELLFGLADAEISLDNMDEGMAISKQLIDEYEDWMGGYAMLGKIYFLKNNFIQSASLLEKSNELEEVAGIYTSLAITYHYLKEHKKAILAMQKAIKLDINELQNRVAVPATAYSLMELGYIDEAENLLMQHQAVRPESQHDPVFVKAAIYLQKKIDEAEKEDASISVAE